MMPVTAALVGVMQTGISESGRFALCRPILVQRWRTYQLNALVQCS